MLLLVGTNPKYESPVLNARILKATRKNLKVFNIGTNQDLNYKTVHLGSSTKVLSEIAAGSHPFAERLKKAKLPMIIVGANALEREDGAAILNTLKTIANNGNVISTESSWNGFNILHKDSGRINALELGINPTTVSKKSKLIFILGADNNLKPADIPEDAFVVYIGTHGDEGAYYADVILPSAAYTEKNATWVNTEGRVQLGRLVVTSPGDSREDW